MLTKGKRTLHISMKHVNFSEKVVAAMSALLISIRHCLLFTVIVSIEARGWRCVRYEPFPMMSQVFPTDRFVVYTETTSSGCKTYTQQESGDIYERDLSCIRTQKASWHPGGKLVDDKQSFYIPCLNVGTIAWYRTFYIAKAISMQIRMVLHPRRKWNAGPLYAGEKAIRRVNVVERRNTASTCTKTEAFNHQTISFIPILPSSTGGIYIPSGRI